MDSASVAGEHPASVESIVLPTSCVITFGVEQSRGIDRWACEIDTRENIQRSNEREVKTVRCNSCSLHLIDDGEFLQGQTPQSIIATSQSRDGCLVDRDTECFFRRLIVAQLIDNTEITITQTTVDTMEVHSTASEQTEKATAELNRP